MLNFLSEFHVQSFWGQSLFRFLSNLKQKLLLVWRSDYWNSYHCLDHDGRSYEDGLFNVGKEPLWFWASNFPNLPSWAPFSVANFSDKAVIYHDESFLEVIVKDRYSYSLHSLSVSFLFWENALAHRWCHPRQEPEEQNCALA